MIDCSHDALDRVVEPLLHVYDGPGPRVGFVQTFGGEERGQQSRGLGEDTYLISGRRLSVSPWPS